MKDQLKLAALILFCCMSITMLFAQAPSASAASRSSVPMWSMVQQSYTVLGSAPNWIAVKQSTTPPKQKQEK